MYKLFLATSLAAVKSFATIETLSLKTIKPSECKLAFSKPPTKEILSEISKPLIETATPLATLKANVSESVSPLIIEMPVLFAMLNISESVSAASSLPPQTLNLPLPVTLLIEIVSAPASPLTSKVPLLVT